MLRPIDEHRVAFYLDVAQSSTVISFRIPSKLDELCELLSYIGISRIHFHHALESFTGFL